VADWVSILCQEKFPDLLWSLPVILKKKKTRELALFLYWADEETEAKGGEHLTPVLPRANEWQNCNSNPDLTVRHLITLCCRGCDRECGKQVTTHQWREAHSAIDGNSRLSAVVTPTAGELSYEQLGSHRFINIHVHCCWKQSWLTEENHAGHNRELGTGELGPLEEMSRVCAQGETEGGLCCLSPIEAWICVGVWNVQDFPCSCYLASNSFLNWKSAYIKERDMLIKSLML
jgi:hypothetical protein